MTRFLMFCFCLCLTVVCFAEAVAQDGPPPPPNVLFIVREEIRPGKDAAHLEESQRYTNVLRKVKSPYGRIGMNAIAGSEHEVLYVWPFDSFAMFEKMNQDVEKWSTGQYRADFEAIAPGEDLHVSQRDMLAVLRPDLSYRTPVNVPEMRYMMIETMRLKPGQDENFMNGARMYIDGLKKGNVDAHFSVFQVIAGAQPGTFLLIEPMKSLAELDKFHERSKALRNALGAEGMKSLDKIGSEVFDTGDVVIYAFNPRMSYVQNDFISKDKASPSFWVPNP